MRSKDKKKDTLADKSVWGEKGRPSLEAIRMETERLNKQKQRKNEISGMISRIVFIVMAVVLMNIYVFRLAVVHGESMEPSLQDGDVVLFTPLGYEPDYGDIVVTEMDVGKGDLIKRVIALAGDIVDINYTTGTVSVNGQILDEPYIKETTYLTGDIQFPVTVPVGRVFLLGDNRNNSVDSRQSVVGMVPKSTLRGKVFFRLLPVSGIGVL